MKRSTKYTLSALMATLSCLVPEGVYSLRSTFKEWSNFNKHLVYHHGKPFMVKTLKEIHQAGKRRLLGVRPKDNYTPYSFWMKTDAYGLPRRLPLLRKLFNSRKRVLQLIAISITSSYLIYTLKPDYDLKDIVTRCREYVPEVSQEYLDYLSESKNLYTRNHIRGKTSFDKEEVRDAFIDFCRWFVPRFRKVPFDRVAGFKSMFTGFKGGPYGVPSFRYSLIDAFNLASEFKTELSSLFQIVELVSPHRVRDFRNSFDEADMMYRDLHGIPPEGANIGSDSDSDDGMEPMMFIAPMVTESHKVDVPVEEPARLAKFSFLVERGGKTRVITAANYWIQQGLFDLHVLLMEVLRSIREDYAFNQDDAAQFILSMTSHGKRYAARSRDMTGATNRFPLWVQQLILNLIKPTLGDHWARLMSIPIFLKEGVSHCFAAGQPMGIYSSWPAFSLSHHVVVRFCAWYCGLNPFTFRRYCIIGDDVVIFDRKVDRIYMYFMVEVLGVDISSFKSFSTTKKSPRFAEFAKRLYRDGREYSPLSPYMLMSARSADVTLIKDIIDRVVCRWGIKPRTFLDGTFVKVLFKRILFVGQRNAAMCWFLQDNVTPVGHIQATGLEQLREEIWKSSLEPYTGLIALSQYEKRKRSVMRLESDLKNIESRLLSLYGRSVSRSTSELRYPLIPTVNVQHTYPVVNTVRKLQLSVSALGKYPSQSKLSNCLVIYKWITNYLEGKIDYKGNFHFQKRELRAKLSKQLALTVQRRFKPAIRNLSESSVATYSRPFYVPGDVRRRRR